MAGGSHYELKLPAGKYWVRTESKKNTLAVMLEPGEKYFIRVSYGVGAAKIEQVDPNVGEVQASDASFMDPTQYQEFAKDEQALLSANPRE